MKQVLEYGHRNIALLTLSEGDQESIVPDSITWFRMAGYKAALDEYHIDIENDMIIEKTSDCTIKGGRNCISKMLNSGKMPSVIVCMSDVLAIGCLLEIKERGFTVPGDISIAGFDNIIESTLVSPLLSTVDQPGEDKGRLAAVHEARQGIVRGGAAEKRERQGGGLSGPAGRARAGYRVLLPN